MIRIKLGLWIHVIHFNKLGRLSKHMVKLRPSSCFRNLAARFLVRVRLQCYWQSYLFWKKWLKRKLYRSVIPNLFNLRTHFLYLVIKS